MVIKNKHIQTTFSIKIFLFALLVVSIHSTSFAQQGIYRRKSIAYVDALIYKTGEIRCREFDERYLLLSISNAIIMPRFDFNPLPESVQLRFRDECLKMGKLSNEQISDLVSTIIAPQLVKVLDIHKEMRAENLVTEAQRNSFIALKAKEIGITAEQLEQVMNSSYLYIPCLSEYKFREDRKENRVDIEIECCLIWYHLIADDSPRVERVGIVSSKGVSSAVMDSEYQFGGKKVSSREYAFRSAVETLAMNLQVKVRDMEIFKIHAPIAEVDGWTVRFPLGIADGILMDAPFYVGEWVETENGEIGLKTSGFIRIGTVADNRKSHGQLSTGWAIKKGDWVRGMMVIEHPRLGIDFGFKARWFTLNINEGVLLSEDFLIKFDGYSGGAVGSDFDFQLNIAHLLNSRQTFLVVGGFAGLAPVRSRIYDSPTSISDLPSERSLSSIFNGHVGFMKKFYFRSIALHLEALAGVQILSVTDHYRDEDVSISSTSGGLKLNVGLEYAYNIDCNIGFFAGLTFFPPMDLWTVKYRDEEIEVKNCAPWDTPAIYSRGPSFGFYVHYSLPSLRFNPFAILQSQLSKVYNEVYK